MLASEYTLGTETIANPYHVDLVRSQLTRQIGVLVKDVKEEVQDALEDATPLGLSGEWVSLPTFDTVMEIIARATSRAFVGPPFCLSPNFVAFQTLLHGLFPSFFSL